MPRLKRDSEVHDRQERVYTIRFHDQVGDNFVTIHVNLTFVLALCGSRHQIYAVLCPQLENLHFLVDFHIAIFSFHAPIQDLIEEYIPVVRFDSHLEEMLLDHIIFIFRVI